VYILAYELGVLSLM